MLNLFQYPMLGRASRAIVGRYRFGARWTLKRVQGDGKSVGRDGTPAA